MITQLNRVMLGYSVVTTTALAVLTISQAMSGASPPRASFDEIDVHRINVRENDGRLRMTISSSDKAPGLIVKGKEQPHPNGRKEAGVLFFDDEGTENGGLAYGGAQRDGRVSSFGHLSFDQYQQDQVLSLDQSQSDGRYRAGLSILDRPATPIPWDQLKKLTAPENRAQLAKMGQEGAFGYRRLFVGKADDRSSAVMLQDAKGRPRLLMKVSADGAATIEFLDENGKPVRTLTPTTP